MNGINLVGLLACATLPQLFQGERDDPHSSGFHSWIGTVTWAAPLGEWWGGPSFLAVDAEEGTYRVICQDPRLAAKARFLASKHGYQRMAQDANRAHLLIIIHPWPRPPEATLRGRQWVVQVGRGMGAIHELEDLLEPLKREGGWGG